MAELEEKGASPTSTREAIEAIMRRRASIGDAAPLAGPGDWGPGLHRPDDAEAFGEKVTARIREVARGPCR